VSTPPISKSSQSPATNEKKVIESSKELGISSQDFDTVSDEIETKKSLPVSGKDIILGVINIISIVLLAVILVKFPSKANELKDLRIEQVKSESGSGFEYSEIESHRAHAQALGDLFLDEPGVVEFVNSIERLKSDEAAIQRVSFASQKVVKDKTGNYGILVVIELSGTWEAIQVDLKRIGELPFLFRAARIETKTNEEGVILLKYGGFLYVSDKLGKDR